MEMNSAERSLWKTYHAFHMKYGGATEAEAKQMATEKILKIRDLKKDRGILRY